MFQATMFQGHRYTSLVALALGSLAGACGDGDSATSTPGHEHNALGGADGGGSSAGGSQTCPDVADGPREIYVSPSGSNETGNGTRECPWLTIKKAVALAQPGDTVVAMAGSYEEPIALDGKSGAPGAPITIRSEHPCEAKLDGRLALGKVTAQGETWRKLDPVKDLGMVKQPDANTWGIDVLTWHVGEAVRDGAVMHPYPTHYWECDPDLFKVGQSCPWTHGDTFTLVVYLEPDGNPQSSSWEVDLRYGIWLRKLEYVDVEGFDVSLFAHSGFSAFETNHVVARGIYSHHNGSGGISTAESNYTLICDSEAAYNGIGAGYGWAIGAYRPAGVHNYMIRNVAHHNTDSTWHTDGSGFMVDGSPDSGPAAGGAVLVSNMAYGNDGFGIAVYNASNVSAVNNTSMCNGRDPKQSWGGELGITPATKPAPVPGEPSVFLMENLTILNNALRACGMTPESQPAKPTGRPAETLAYPAGYTPADLGWKVDFHLYYGDDPKARVVRLGEFAEGSSSATWQYLTLAQVKSAGLTDSHSIAEDPLWPMFGGDEPDTRAEVIEALRLVADSPALDVGAAVPLPPPGLDPWLDEHIRPILDRDIDNEARPIGPGVDIGADERALTKAPDGED